MKLESLLWLLPVFFMLHDMEEIIFLPDWLSSNRVRVVDRVPHVFNGVVNRLARVTHKSFALAVAEEFVLLSAFTFLAVENRWLNAWAAVMVVYCLHVLIHVAQGLIVRMYVPAILSGLAGLIYGVWALMTLNRLHMIAWPSVMAGVAIVLPLVAANIAFAQLLGSRLEHRRQGRKVKRALD